MGVIGVGVMGADHARTLARSGSGAQVTVVTDYDAVRADSVAQEVSARAVATAEELITAPDIDAVVIASHDSAHAEQVKLCLVHRKPVLCEKPLAPTVDHCRDLVATEDALGLAVPLVSVGFMRRFHHPYVALADEVRSGTIGTPLLVRSSHRNVSAYPGGTSADTITNSAIHEIDVTSWLLGSPIVEVSWHAPKPTSLDTSRHDPQVLMLRTADGVLTVVDVFVNARNRRDQLGCAARSVGRFVAAIRLVVSGGLAAPVRRRLPAPVAGLDRRPHREGAVSARVRPRLVAGATEVAAALIHSMNNDGATSKVEHTEYTPTTSRE